MIRIVLAWTLIVCGLVQAQDNLVPDGSFEGRLPLWLPDDPKLFDINKFQTPTAANGKSVALIQGWQAGAATILSPELTVKPQPVSMTCRVRHRGAAGEVSVELILLDGDGRRIGTTGAWQADGSDEWQTLSRADIAAGDGLTGLLDELDGGEVTSNTMSLRLVFKIVGPQRGHQLEVDQLGLFPGSKLPAVTDNAVELLVGAEDFKGWAFKTGKAIYPGGRVGRALVSGKSGDVASATVEVPRAGRYRTWLRFRSLMRAPSERQMTLQVGKTKGLLQGVNYGGREDARWVWGYVDAQLPTGASDIRLTAKKAGLRMTHMLVTNNLDYLPSDNDFLTTQLHLRFTNKSTDQEPFLLWVYIRTHDIKAPHNHMGMLGLSGVVGPFPPKDEDLFLRPGDTTPWLRVSDVLHADMWTNLNTLSLIATRKTRLGGHVRGRIQGRLEFAVGPERRVIKTIEIDQWGPGYNVTLPYDAGRHPEQLMGPMDYVAQKQEVMKDLPARQHANAKHLEIMVSNPGVGVIPSALVMSELSIVRTLGANTIWRVPRHAEAITMYAEEGMNTRFTLDIHSVWPLVKENSLYHPDLAEIEKDFASAAKEYAATGDHIRRVILADEPGGIGHGVLINSPAVEVALKAYLEKAGVVDPMAGELEELMEVKEGFAPFDPVEHPERRLEWPKEFYHTELFRLQGMAHFCRELTRIKDKYFPREARTLVNHVPYHSAYGSWVKRGVDPFFLHRGKDGLQLPWTEDWMAYGAGPQEMSPLYAMLRSAGRDHGDSIGGYVVVKDGTPELVRMKLYTALAGGVREIMLYNYDPPYSGWLNSWSEQFEKYPLLQQTLEEFGVVDEALHESTRAPTDIAILYNRTQAIWNNPGFDSYYDSDLVHWALAHAGYDADILCEEDVEAGRLQEYKVLYAGGTYVKQSVATAVAAWVEGGGTLCGLTGAGVRNEYREPMKTWQVLFGVVATEQKGVGVKLPRQGMKTLGTLGVLTSTGDAPRVSFPNYGFTETLEPSSARVFLTGEDGSAAGTIRSVGKGRALRIAGAPGTAYLTGAVKDEAYDVKAFLPKAFDPALRDLIAWPTVLAGARRVVSSDEPILEVARYEKAGTTVLVVIDHDVLPKDRVVLKVPGLGTVSSARTATGAEVLVTMEGDTAVLSLPMAMCEAIILEHEER